LIQENFAIYFQFFSLYKS